jgi:parvulin-like peptidyl-prolyl isomerase
MNRRVLAGMLGLAVAGCAQSRATQAPGGQKMPPVGLGELPSIHQWINADLHQLNPDSRVTMRDADPAEPDPIAAGESLKDQDSGPPDGSTKGKAKGKEKTAGRTQVADSSSPYYTRPKWRQLPDDPAAADKGKDSPTRIVLETTSTARPETAPGESPANAATTVPAARPGASTSEPPAVAAAPMPAASSNPADLLPIADLSGPVGNDPSLGVNPDVMSSVEAPPQNGTRTAVDAAAGPGSQTPARRLPTMAELPPVDINAPVGTDPSLGAHPDVMSVTETAPGLDKGKNRDKAATPAGGAAVAPTSMPTESVALDEPPPIPDMPPVLPAPMSPEPVEITQAQAAPATTPASAAKPGNDQAIKSRVVRATPTAPGKTMPLGELPPLPGEATSSAARVITVSPTAPPAIARAQAAPRADLPPLPEETSPAAPAPPNGRAGESAPPMELPPLPGDSAPIAASNASPAPVSASPAGQGPAQALPPLPDDAPPASLPPLPADAPPAGLPPLPADAPPAGLPQLPGEAPPPAQALPPLPGEASNQPRTQATSAAAAEPPRTMELAELMREPSPADADGTRKSAPRVPAPDPPGSVDPEVRTVAADPAAVRTELSSRGPAKAGQIAARVGDEVITLKELRSVIEKQRQGAQLSQEEKFLLYNQALDHLIDQVLVLQEVHRTIKDAKKFDMFKDVIKKIWVEEELPPLLRRSNTANEYELRRKMAEQGISLDAMREEFCKTRMTQEFMSMKIRPLVTVDKPEMLDYYNAHLKDYDRPAQITWREVVVEVPKHANRAEARRNAEGLFDRLRRGEDFAKLAKAESESPSPDEGGLWKTSPGASVVPAVNDALGRLPLNQISPILEGPAGFHIVRVEARREAGTARFDEVQDEIKQALAEEKFQRETRTYIAKLRSGSLIRTMFEGGPSTPSLTSNTPPRVPAASAPAQPE